MSRRQAKKVMTARNRFYSFAADRWPHRTQTRRRAERVIYRLYRRGVQRTDRWTRSSRGGGR